MMKYIPKLKFHAAIAAFTALGGFLLLVGAVRSKPVAEKQQPQLEREWTNKGHLGTYNSNTLKGNLTINKAPVVSKGILMVFAEGNAREAATYGEITEGGSFSILGVPEGPVRIVLRPDPETVLSSYGIPKTAGFKIKAKRSEAANDGISEGKVDVAPTQTFNTPFTSYLNELPEPKRLLLYEAFSKYEKPRSKHAIKTIVSVGANIIDIDLKVP